jgi:hypothetical protein
LAVLPNTSIAAQRLHNQRLTHPGPRQAADVVAWCGAVQAQEYQAAKWAVGLRMPEGATDTQVERAFNDGRIVRTHVLRPTWHFVAAADIHWMLELTAPRVHRALATANRYFEVDAATRARAARIFERALRDGESLTRAELGDRLSRAGVVAKSQRLALLAIHAELEGIICSGPQRGKLLTYMLLSTRVPIGRRLSRDEALAELTRRYFRSHGPATIRDFVWWSGLTTADARRGLEIAGARQEVIDPCTYWTVPDRVRANGSRASVHLLPIFDEYLVAYRDLHAVPRRSGSGGRLEQAVVAAGQIVGTWKAVGKPEGLVLEVTVQRPLTGNERRLLTEVAARYGRFLSAPVSVMIS